MSAQNSSEVDNNESISAKADIAKNAVSENNYKKLVNTIKQARKEARIFRRIVSILSSNTVFNNKNNSCIVNPCVLTNATHQIDSQEHNM